MKRVIIISIICVVFFGSLALYGQAKSIKATSSIRAVTVFEGQAMVTRNYRNTFAPGRYLVKFSRLPAGLIDESVRVSGRGSAGAKVLNVNVSADYLKESIRENVRDLEKKVSDIDAQITELDDQLKVLDKREKLLNRMTAKTTETIGRKRDKDEKPSHPPPLAQWKDMLEFVEKQLLDLKKRRRAIADKKLFLDTGQRVLRDRLRASSSANTKKVKTVLVDLEVKNEGPVTLDISYFIPGASWAPVYDIRFPEDGNSGDLVYSAMVGQVTGEDWKNVYLTLSTTKPSLLKGIPELKPIFLSELKSGQGKIVGVVTLADGSNIPGVTVTLDYSKNVKKRTVTDYQGQFRFSYLHAGLYDLSFELEGFKTVRRLGVPVSGGKTRNLNVLMETQALMEMITVSGRAPGVDLKATSVGSVRDVRLLDGINVTDPTKMQQHTMELPSADVSAHEISAEFKIKKANSIVTNKDSRRVTVAVIPVPVEKEYIAFPRLSSQVYLKIKTENASAYPLIPGKMNVFYGGALVNKSRMEFLNPGEDFDVPMGIDEAIRVKRKLVKAETGTKGMFKKKTVKSYHYKITVENKRKNRVSVTVTDLIPVSTTDFVQVKTTKVTPTTIKDKELEKKGFLKWKLILNPGETKDIDVHYTVEYPRGVILEEK